MISQFFLTLLVNKSAGDMNHKILVNDTGKAIM